MAPTVEIEPCSIVQPAESTVIGGGKERPEGDMVASAQMKSTMKKMTVSADVTPRSLWSRCGWIKISGSEAMLKMM